MIDIFKANSSMEVVLRLTEEQVITYRDHKAQNKRLQQYLINKKPLYLHRGGYITPKLLKNQIRFPELKKRLEILKKHIPKRYMGIVLYKFPSAHALKVRQVVGGTLQNIQILEMLESIFIK